MNEDAESLEKKSKKKRLGKHLDHFNRFEEFQSQSENSSLIDKLSRFFSSPPNGKEDETRKPHAVSLKTQFKSKKKTIFFFTLALLAILLAVLIVPQIKAKSKYNSGLSAFNAGDYQSAFSDLSLYVQNNPTDHEAILQLGVTAFRIGKYDDATNTFRSIYENKDFPNNPQLSYYYALSNLHQPEFALKILDEIITIAPDSIAPRVLRGYLLKNSPSDIRKAREDFLHADNITRLNTYDSRDGDALLFFHRYMQNIPDGLAINIDPSSKNTFETDDLKDESQVSALEKRLNFDPQNDGLILRYSLSNSDIFIEDRLAPQSIIGIYFSYMLMAQGEFQEADTTLNEISLFNPMSPSILQANAFLHVYQEKHQQAVDVFEQISTLLPEDVTTLKNLAIAQQIAFPFNFPLVQSTYNQILTLLPEDHVALNNSIYTGLLSGDFEKAKQLSEKLKPSAEYYQTQINLALIEFISQNYSQALNLLNSTPSSASKFEGIDFYKTIIMEKSGDEYQSIEAFQRISNNTNSPFSQLAALHYISLLEKVGDWLSAEHEFRISRYLERYPNSPEFIYRFSRLRFLIDKNQNNIEKSIKNLSANQKTLPFSLALMGLEREIAGSLEKASQFYLMAMESSPSYRLKVEFALYWSAIEFGFNNNNTIIEKLSVLFDETHSPQIAAVLANAFYPTDRIRAIQFAEIALRDNRSHSNLIQLGEVYTQLGNYPQAITILLLAEKWAPTNTTLLNNLLLSYKESNQNDKAQQIEEKVTYLEKLGEKKAHVSNLSFSIIFPPFSKELNSKIQKVMATNKKSSFLSSGISSGISNALIEYDTLLEKTTTPEDRAIILYSLATFYAYLGRWGKSAETFVAAFAAGISNKSDLAQATILYSEVLTMLERYEQSEQSINQAIALIGENLLYLKQKALVLRKKGEIEKSINAFIYLLQKYPGEVSSYHELAKTYYDFGNIDDALSTLQKLIRVSPFYAPTYKLLIDIYRTKYNDSSHYEKLYSSIYSSLK